MVSVDVPGDIWKAADMIRGIEWAEDTLSREGGGLMWATAESYYELLRHATTLSEWVLTLKKSSGQS